MFFLTEHILCNKTALDPCPGDNQICKEATSECVCKEGFVFVGVDCEPPDSGHDRPDHTATTAIVTIFALVLVMCGLVLVVRKYNLVEYVRQKINSRRNNDVMYEDVMIGNDDPPLSP